MDAYSLPLISSDDEGHYFLPIKGIEPEELTGVEFRVRHERGLLEVFCYTNGFNEEGDCEGRYIPIVIDELNQDAVEKLRTLQIGRTWSVNI
jgi:hypothetical protein